MKLLDIWSQWHSETGEASTAILATLTDGNITKKEMNDICREVHEDFSR